MLDAEGVEPGACTDDVDDRVYPADLMEVHLFEWLAVGLRLGRGEGGKDGESSVADGWRQGRFLEQEANGCASHATVAHRAGSTRTRVPRTAPDPAGCDVIWTPSMPSRETASWIDVRGAPASTRAPRIMSPLAPENGSKTAMRDKKGTSPRERDGRFARIAGQA